VQKSGAPITKTLLIYIPCHSDFEMALENADRVRVQFRKFGQNSIYPNLAIQIVISVNGVELSRVEKNELERVADQLLVYSAHLGGDININQGFVKALEIEPDYFWILSANEILVENAIGNLFNKILSHPFSDVFITNSMDRTSTFETDNFFLDLPPGLGTGLISSVVYNFGTMQQAFSAGPRFGWTGWGQLAVIEFGCRSKGTLVVTEMPDSEIYLKPFTFLEDKPKSSEFEVVRKNYAHSYFGMVVLISILFAREQSKRNRILKLWLAQNWYKLRYFKTGIDISFKSRDPQFDSLWVQKFAFRILKSTGLTSFLIVQLFANLNLEILRSNLKIRSIKNFLSK
jgi:hypothetical protein